MRPSPILATLGTTYGYFHPTPTTHNDHGVLDGMEHPVRRAWREAQPTVYGLLAGSFALLRDPYVVVAVQSGAIRVPLAQHLLGVWGSMLAGTFGDRATHARVRQMLGRAHKVEINAKVPEWYRDIYGNDPIVISPSMRYAVMTSLLGGVINAHLATALVSHATDSSRYVEGLQQTIADLHEVRILPEGPDGTYSLRTLTVANETYGGQPQMSSSLARRAGILGDNGVLQQLLDTDLGGVTIRTLYDSFGGLVPEDVREALELKWGRTDQARLNDWAGDYADKVQASTDRDRWFDVAVRTRRQR